jgi:hypothetical protein
MVGVQVSKCGTGPAAASPNTYEYQHDTWVRNHVGWDQRLLCWCLLRIAAREHSTSACNALPLSLTPIGDWPLFTITCVLFVPPMRQMQLY